MKTAVSIAQTLEHTAVSIIAVYTLVRVQRDEYTCILGSPILLLLRHGVFEGEETKAQLAHTAPRDIQLMA